MIITTAPATKVIVGSPEHIIVSGGDQDPTNISVPSGQPGPPGPPGPQGIPGDSSTALGYTHVQGVPSAVWTIVHPLSYYPNITVVTSSGEEVEGDVAYSSPNTLTVTFSGAFSGTAYLS